MQKLVWINSKGTEINLTSGDYGITEWEGFSACDLEVQTQNVPFQDGSVFLDALLNNRELSVTLAINDGKDLEKRYRLRRELISALNPKLGEGYLIYTNDFISKRIKCLAQMPVFPTHNSDKAGTPKASLSWTACDPYWEDLEETELTILSNNYINAINEGDIETSANLKLIGNVTDGKLVCENQQIKFEGLSNNYTEIFTGKGNKKAFSKDFQNVNVWINDEIYSSIELNNEEFLLGGNKLYSYNKLKNQISKITPLINGNYVNYLTKIDGIYYALTSDEVVIGKYNTSSRINTNSYILQSSDAINWELKKEFASDILPIKMEKLGDKFYLLNRNNFSIVTSEDLENFESHYAVSGGSSKAFDFYIDNNICIIVGGDLSGSEMTPLARYSTDNLQTFSNCNISYSAQYANHDRMLTKIVKFNNKFVIFATDSRWGGEYSFMISWFYSSDGINFNYDYNRSSIANFQTFISIHSYNNYLFAFKTYFNSNYISSNNNGYIDVFDKDLNFISEIEITKCFTYIDNFFIGLNVNKYDHLQFYLMVSFYYSNIQINNSAYINMYKTNKIFRIVMSNANTNVKFYYGNISSQTEYTTRNSGSKFSEVFEIQNYIYIIFYGAIYRYNKETEIIERYYISLPQGYSYLILTKHEEHIFVLGYNSSSKRNKIFKMDLNFIIKDSFEGRYTGYSSFTRLFYINDSLLIAYTWHISGQGQYGSFVYFYKNGNMFEQPITDRLFLNYYNELSYLIPYYNKYLNLFFMIIKSGDSSVYELFYSADVKNWVNTGISNVKYVYNIYDIFVVHCEDAIYALFDIGQYQNINIPISEIGINYKNDIINFEVDNSGYAKNLNELNMDLISNVIKKFKNGLQLDIPKGTSEIRFESFNGSGYCVLSYRQKYIGV